MKIKFILYYCTSIFLLFSCQNPSVVEWVVSTPNQSWELQQNIVQHSSADSADAIVDITDPLQIIDGFGTCFNEMGQVSLNILDEKDRNVIMKEFFEPGVGANFTICRMPIGANDFSRNWYSYNETEGDFEMKDFSISNDKETLIPFIKNAMRLNPNIKIWASPWSPPSWMKYNKHYACAVPPEDLDEKYRNDLPADKQGREGTDMFIQEDNYFKAYALYFSKFVEAYRKEGIDIFMVMPQNEFNSCQIFPSCTWRSSSLNKFVGEYLGPAMKRLNVDIMFGTMERHEASLVDTVLTDPKSKEYVKGVGFQWGGIKSVGVIHQNYPDMKIYQTEQECGDGRNDWNFCRYAWTLMKHYLENGANTYTYWNTSLEQGGVSRWGWSQNSLVTVDPQTRTYKFNYEYYLMKHFSHYVLPGARRLPVSGIFTNLLAFKNPDNSIILVAHNDKDNILSPVVQIGAKKFSLELKPQSFNSFVIK